MEFNSSKIWYPLIPFSWLYGIGVSVRNFLFDCGLLRSSSYDIPVISVGNITVGGTGKTPLTEYLIRLLSPKHQATYAPQVRQARATSGTSRSRRSTSIRIFMWLSTRTGVGPSRTYAVQMFSHQPTSCSWTTDSSTGMYSPESTSCSWTTTGFRIKTTCYRLENFENLSPAADGPTS